MTLAAGIVHGLTAGAQGALDGEMQGTQLRRALVSYALEQQQLEGQIARNAAQADYDTARAQHTRHVDQSPVPGDASYTATFAPIWQTRAAAEEAGRLPGQEALADHESANTLHRSQSLHAPAQSPAFRTARANFAANQQLVTDARQEATRLDNSTRTPLGPLATAQDSAARTALVGQDAAAHARLNTLRARSDSMAEVMRRAGLPFPGQPFASSVAMPPQTGPDGITRQPVANASSAAQEYARAADAFQREGGPSNPQARALYDRVVAAIAQKYGHQ